MRIQSKKIIRNCLLFIISATLLFAQSEHTINTISVLYNSQPLRSILLDISSRTDVGLIFSDNNVDGIHLSCEYNEQDLTSVLEDLCRKAGLKFRFMNEQTAVIYREREKTAGNGERARAKVN